MNEKMKSCFTPHVVMHSLFGFGLGIILANQVDVLNKIWVGLVCMVVAVALDAIKKS